MRVAMIGTGYVGLVSGACFADFGHHVTCVDKDADKIAVLERGELPIYEPGLDGLVAGNVRAQRLSFTTDLQGPVAQADAVFLGDKLKPVLDAIVAARRARKLMMQNLWLAAIYNAIAVPVAIAGAVTPLVAALAMSGSSLLVTLNAMRANGGTR